MYIFHNCLLIESPRAILFALVVVFSVRYTSPLTLNMHSITYLHLRFAKHLTAVVNYDRQELQFSALLVCCGPDGQRFKTPW